MRWHVHGTDSASGRKVTLAVEDGQATDAVQAAMAKGIVVTHVTHGPRIRILSIGFATTLAASIALAAGCRFMSWRESEANQQLAAAMAEEARLATALTESGGTVTALQRRTAALEEAQGGAARQLVDQLESARQRVVTLDQELTGAHARVADLEKKAAAAGTANGQLKLQLAAAQNQASQTEEQLRAERQRMQDMEKARQTTARLEKSNQELSSTVELLKGQLLEQAAKSVAVPVVQVNEPPPPSPRRVRWGLKTSYDKASDFLALRFEKDASPAPAVDGAAVTSGMLAGNVATLRLLHDPEKRQLYSATLTVSLAPDGPREKLQQNQALLAEFLKEFAPGLKESEAWVADSIRQLDGRSANQRLVRLGEDYKLTVWNNHLGLFSWKIESPRAELED